MDGDHTAVAPVRGGDHDVGSGTGGMTLEGRTVPAIEQEGDALSQLPYGMGHRMLMIAEVADWFRVPIKTVRGWVNRRSIPYRKVGDLLRFPEQELEAWSRPKPKTTEPAPQANSTETSPHIRPARGRLYKSVKLGVYYDT